MTTPIADPGVPPTRQPKPTSFVDWFNVNSRWVGIGAVLVAVAGAVAWYVPHQRALASQQADRMLLTAKQSYASGNAQLAESDLKKVADRYPDQPSGIEAGMMIAQLRLERNDAAGAATYLQDVARRAGDGPEAAAVRGLLADALVQSGKAAEGAAEYEKAAGLTRMPNERALLLSRAGYAWMGAGKTAEARKVFEVLSTQQESRALADEAHVRLGELAAAAPRS